MPFDLFFRSSARTVSRSCLLNASSTNQGTSVVNTLMAKKLLVVDDDKDTRMALLDRLLSMGFDVVTENNGHSALSRIALEARRAPIQGVLLDLEMPMFDGMAVLREVQARHREIPVIIMSATSDMSLIESALQLGACAYLKKPVNNRLLRAQCHRVFLGTNELPDNPPRDAS